MLLTLYGGIMKNPDQIKKSLLALRRELEDLRDMGKSDQKPVTLDQQSVGRLSRMDALQIQAMDKAKDARRALELKRIEGALLRLEEGEYGYCTRCGEEIAPERLNQDPAAPFCIVCA